MKRFFIAALLVDFAVLTAYALFASGFSGMIDFFASGNLWTYQLTADFLIALGISVAWMIGDARKRGVSWTPYLVLTLCLGSIGPLLYAVIHVVRGRASERSTAPRLVGQSRAAA